MKRLATTIRIGFVMTLWSATVLLGLHLFQVFDDDHETILVSRTRLCEAVAVSCSQLASHDDHEGIRAVLESFVERDGDVLSARFRQSAGSDAAIANLTIGDHDDHWSEKQASFQKADQIVVPVVCADQPCGELEIAFRSPVGAAILGFIRLPSPKVTLLASSLNLLVFSIWMGRCFDQADKSRAVLGPNLSLAKDPLVFDNQRRDGYSSAPFAAILAEPLNYWKETPFVAVQRRRPAPDIRTKHWLNCLRVSPGTRSLTQNLYQLTDLPSGGGPLHSFNPCLHPLDGANRQAQGILSHASNFTFFEEDDEEIGKTLERLKASQREIEEQNKRLTYLATRDPMTGCLNRRSLFEHFEDLWRSSNRYGHPLSCVMLDVDHFKSINDEHGHQVGDHVLEQVASALNRTARETDFVCRYGGEEFCILLPHVDLAGAWFASERFREAVEALQFDGFTITVSLGCSDREQGAADAAQMLDQADQALYYSKRNGRNRSTSFDQIPAAKSNIGDASARKNRGDCADRTSRVGVK